jgi:3-oxoacyl-[acyl-carrier-protein] synthase-3
MKFKHVVIQALAAIEPPIRVTSREIEQKLKPTLDRLGVRDDLLEEVSGIGARRFWERGTTPSDAATLAAEKALDESGIDRQKVGVISPRCAATTSSRPPPASCTATSA